MGEGDHVCDETKDTTPFKISMVTHLKIDKNGDFQWLRRKVRLRLMIEYAQQADGSVERESCKIHTAIMSTQHVEPWNAPVSKEVVQ